MNFFSILGAGGTEVSPLFGLLTFVLVGVVLVSLVLLVRLFRRLPATPGR